MFDPLAASSARWKDTIKKISAAGATEVWRSVRVENRESRRTLRHMIGTGQSRRKQNPAYRLVVKVFSTGHDLIKKIMPGLGSAIVFNTAASTSPGGLRSLISFYMVGSIPTLAIRPAPSPDCQRWPLGILGRVFQS